MTQIPAQFWALVKRNPTRAYAAVVSLIAVGTAFGLGWTGAQVGAITGAVAGILAFFTEQAVTPLEAPVIPSGTTITVATPVGQPDEQVTV